VTNDSYKIGYKKPPKHTQFQKRQSGNPKGRPKVPKNLPALILRIFGEKVVVKSSGRRHSMTKLEAVLVQLINKALGGDIGAFREVIRLREKVQELEPYLTPAPEFVVNFIDPVTKKLVTTEDLEE
jgi:hypothetical protein